MKRIALIFLVWTAVCACAAEVVFPRVWTSTGGCRTAEEFERMAADCAAHGVQVVESHGGDAKFLAAQLAICRKYGLKMFFGIEDASKTDRNAKSSGLYELAVMSGGCYRGLAIDRNLFAFTPGRHEIIVEPPVYSRNQAYAKHPHYYMLGDGHYFGGYVPTGKAEVIVPERLFDRRQHLRILPAKVEWAPPDAKLEKDSAAHLADAKEIKERRLVKLTFDLTGLEACRLDKVGLAVYWSMDDKSPDWKPHRTCYSVFSPHTRQRMRWRVQAHVARWREANGGTFPADVVVAVRLGDEIFNATSFLDGPAVSFPLWGFSASARAAFAAATPEGVTYPRTWGASEVYGPDACAQSLYLFHKACADYLKVAVDEFHAAVPTLQTFRNTTRGGVWSYANDHDGTGQELLAEVLDFLHLDPYPVHEGGYNGGCIPVDMAYMSGLARRYKKKLVPWLQAHRFPSGKLVHPTPDDLRRIYDQHTRFAPDGIMWLGYNPRGDSCTFPNGNTASWETAAKIHADFLKRPAPVRARPDMAVVRPYSARALICEGGDGTRHPEDAILCEFVRIWSRELSREYDIFEVPPFESEAARAKRAAELARYKFVVSSVDWPCATNVAAGCADKVFTKKDFAKKREELRQLAASMANAHGLRRACGEEIVCQFTGAEGRKAATLMEERVFGAAAKGPIYEETVNAFRTHQDDSGIWQGEYWGKTMLSAAVVAEWTGNEAHKAWLRDQARAFVKEFQQPDGYLCTYTDRRFVGGPKPDAEKRKGWDREVFCWNLWGRKYTMWALIEIARVADAPDLLAAAARMMDQEIRQLKESGVRIENTGFFVGLPSMSVLKPLMVLWRATKNEEYLKFAQEIVAAWDRAGNPMPNLVANAFSDKSVYEWYPDPGWWAKAYEMMSCMEGLVDFACDRKDARVLDAVRRLAAKIAKDEMNAVGGVGYFDHFTHAAACVNATTEPCDVVHWMRVNRALFLATDAPSYLDDLETTFFNAFLAGVYRDGKWGAHSVRSHGTRHRTAPHQVGMKFHQCCIDNMPRGFVDVAQTVVTRAPDGAVSLNLCLDADVRFPEGTISISGGYPYADRARVRVIATRKFRLRIRVPAAPDSLLVDGRAAEGRWFFADVAPGERTFDLQFKRSPRIVGNPSARAEDRREGQFEEVKENPEMKGRARQKVGTRILHGPLILAKGRYAGTSDEEIFRDRVADGEWKAAIRPIEPRKTSGAWLLTLSRGTEQVEIPVSDFASVADADDAENRFSIWF